MSKVLVMLDELQGKVVREGKEAQKVYDEFSAWCQGRSKNVDFEIKTGQGEVADLSAVIEKESAKMSAANTRIEELSGSIASDEADLRAASEIRTSESADFAAAEKETLEVIATMQRAVAELSRVAAKGGASMLQKKEMPDITQALDAMVEASVLSSADASRLTALVQDSQKAKDADGDAAPYEAKSGGVVSTLEDLLDKAQAQLDAARKTEATNSHNFLMLKQSLQGEIEAGEKDMSDTKKSLAISEEAKATAQGDLSTTDADLKEDIATVAALKQDCTTGTEDYQQEAKSRSEELKALADAKTLLGQALPAAEQTYGGTANLAADFLQISSSDSELSSRSDLAHFEAVRMIRDLARKQNSVDLAQLASRMSAAIRYGSTAGTNPFSKVKGLISGMIAKLEKDALGELSHKSFCDKETSETNSKKEEKTNEINKLSTKVESMTAKSARIKEEVATIQKEQADMYSSQAEMDKIRSDEKAFFSKHKSELESGISSVQKALSVLRDYFLQEEDSHAAAGGAGSGIIGLLEVVESDFTKGLSEMEVTESTAVKEYERTNDMNKIAKNSKDKSLEYKAKEAAQLDKSGAETSSDADGVRAELDALLEYLDKLSNMCSAKAEPFEEAKARREAEIAGLKEALAALTGEAVLLEQSSKRSFRGKRNRRI